jgi:hypothetical protein
MSDESKPGPITDDEAAAILQRFVDGHFGNPGEHPRMSIPARPERDDDLRMLAYINQTRDLRAEADRLRAQLAESKDLFATAAREVADATAKRTAEFLRAVASNLLDDGRSAEARELNAVADDIAAGAWRQVT